MKKDQIKVGGHYTAKVSGSIVTVRVAEIMEIEGKPSYIRPADPKGTGLGAYRVKAIKSETHYHCTNLKTGRKVTFRSAAKFRSEVKPQSLGVGGLKGVKVDEIDLTQPPAVVDMECERFQQCLEEMVDPGEQCPHCGGVVPFPIAKPMTAQEIKADPNALCYKSEDEKRPDPIKQTPMKQLAAAFRRKSAAVLTSPVQSIVEQKPSESGASKPPIPSVKPATGLASRLSDQVRLAASYSEAPHVIIVARAGTGKTTTLVEGLKAVFRLGGMGIKPSEQQQKIWDALMMSPKPRMSCFCAFNNSIAAELSRRIPQGQGCAAKTLHGLGYYAVRKAFRLTRDPSDSGRCREIISELVGVDLRTLRKEDPVFLKGTTQLVGICKQNLLGYGGAEELDQLIRHYGIDLENGKKAKAFEMVPRILDRCKEVERDGYIDFDDMIWLPVVLKLPVLKNDILLVDEAQDLNRCQQALAKMAGRRLILCGDDRQAIYGFAGADSESMNRMYKELGGEAAPSAPEDCSVVEVCYLKFRDQDPDTYANQGIKSGYAHYNRFPNVRVGDVVDVPFFGDRQNTQRAVVVKIGSDYKGPMQSVVEVREHRNKTQPVATTPRVLILPLNVTRRCGKAIVEEAKKIVPDFAAHESNPEGIVREALYPTQQRVHGKSYELPYEETYLPQVKDGDMVLCRANAPLVNQCFRFIKRGRKAFIQGRDVAESLLALIERLEAQTTVELISKLQDWAKHECDKENAQRNPSETRLQGLQDRLECLMAFTNECQTVADVKQKIESIFTDGKICPRCSKQAEKGQQYCDVCKCSMAPTPGIKLSSIHRAKGLEAKRVFYIQGFGRPTEKMKPWEQQQEENLRYVAITRAIEELVYVY